MSEPALRNHGLDALLNETAKHGVHPSIVIATDRGHINLRGDLQDGAFSNAVEKVLGLPLPDSAGGMVRGQRRICWLGPDEWLVSTTVDDAKTAFVRLQADLCDRHVAINDQSGGLIEYRLDGDEWLDTLTGGCAIDLRGTDFLPGNCLQTALAKASVLLCRISDDSVRLIVRRSFADYVARWLINASPNHTARLVTD